MKKYWIGTGWKMNHLYDESVDYAKTLKNFIDQQKTTSNIFVCPPFTSLYAVSQILRDSRVFVAAQNSHWLEHGAATGEISPLMVKDAGATMVEIGHSERRASFGENDVALNLKIKSILKLGLIPLLCVGETLQEKNFNVSLEVINKEIKIALCDLPTDLVDHMIIAYEPIWAIGEAGVPASPAYADFIHQEIKSTITKMYGEDISSKIPILYGGSVNIENAVSLISKPYIDGLFIGRSAWNVGGFIKIIEKVESTL